MSERIGRLIVDADLDENEVDELVGALKQTTHFDAERQTLMRIDVFKERNDE